MMPGVFNLDMLPIDLLACLQHYGIPTRLLDVTTNALAALYILCQNLYKLLGESDLQLEPSRLFE